MSTLNDNQDRNVSTDVKKQARFAGALYFAVLLIAPFGLIYVPGKLLDRTNAAATAEHIRNSELLFRLGMVSEVVHEILWVFVVLALYDLLKRIHKNQARQMLILGALVSVPVVLIAVVFEVAALFLAGDLPFLNTFSRPQLDSLTLLFYRLHGQGLNIASIFWGLWLFPFGSLVIKSRFLPQLLGWLLILAGLGYVASAFTVLLSPEYQGMVDRVAGVLEFGELPIILWLLIVGARVPKPSA
jgi:hypothetical protein